MSTMAAAAPRAAPASALALWVFIGVVGMLFFLFSVAYLMRMEGADWQVLPAVPPQLWLSTAVLAATSVAWERARRAARPQRAALLAGAGGLAFLAVQLWAWHTMQRWQLTVDGTPAASFFYLITALHGVHVAGGLAGAAWVLRAGTRSGVALCARYWHFLLGLWLAMFALLFYVTPGVVARVCSQIGLTP